MHISYGANNVYIDITILVLQKCLVNDQYIIPSGDENRANLFGDPIFGVVKHIMIEYNGHDYIYSHEQEIKIAKVLLE